MHGLLSRWAWQHNHDHHDHTWHGTVSEISGQLDVPDAFALSASTPSAMDGHLGAASSYHNKGAVSGMEHSPFFGNARIETVAKSWSCMVCCPGAVSGMERSRALALEQPLRTALELAGAADETFERLRKYRENRSKQLKYGVGGGLVAPSLRRVLQKSIVPGSTKVKRAGRAARNRATA